MPRSTLPSNNSTRGFHLRVMPLRGLLLTVHPYKSESTEREEVQALPAPGDASSRKGQPAPPTRSEGVESARLTTRRQAMKGRKELSRQETRQHLSGCCGSG